jgi:hypothetical protein
LKDAIVGDASKVAPERFAESITIGVVAHTLPIAKDDGVHGSEGLCFLGQLVEQWKDALLAREVNVEAGKAHVLGRSKECRKSVGR